MLDPMLNDICLGTLDSRLFPSLVNRSRRGSKLQPVRHTSIGQKRYLRNSGETTRGS
jgi:hypothetical protein